MNSLTSPDQLEALYLEDNKDAPEKDIDTEKMELKCICGEVLRRLAPEVD